MKKLIIIILLLMPFTLRAQTYEYKDGSNSDQFVTVGSLSPVNLPYIWYNPTVNAYIYLPTGYDSSNTSKKYPLICFFHGVGEAGTDVTKLKNQGLPQLISQGHPPYAVNQNGDTTKFIVIAIQDAYFSPSPSTMNAGVQSLINYYKIHVDQNRIYSTGLSAGGEKSSFFAQQYAYKIPADVSMSPSNHIDYSGVDSFARRHIWYFQGETDTQVSPTNAYNSVDTINKYYPGHASLTTWPGGHCCWNTYYDPTWVDPVSGKTIYQWMMQYDLATENGETLPNQPPVVNAGSDKSITLPTTSTLLSGTATDDHNIVSTLWKLKSGPTTVTFTNANSLSTAVNGLTAAGTYVFTLTATDDSYASSSDDMTVIVNSEPVNQIPVANAGSDQSLSAGITSTTLSGSGTDADGTITSYKWTTSSNASITSSTSASTTITGLSNGNSYTFTLTVTDNDGATDADNVLVTVASPPVLDTPDYKIILSPNAVFYDGNKMFYQMNDLTGSGLVNSLIDEQGADPLNGINTPTPQTTFYPGSSSNIAYPAVAVIDLGGIYKITHEFLYRNFGTDTLNILYGKPFNWSTDTLRYGAGGAGFADIGDTVYTRYLKVFYSLHGYQKFKELILYGHLVGDSLSRINSNLVHKSTSTMGQFIGVNVYGVTPEPVREVGGMLRKYTNQSYIDTVRAGVPVDSVEFVFTKYAGNTQIEDYFFPYGFDQGPKLEWNPSIDTRPDNIGLYWATQGIPQYAIDNGWKKSIDYNLHPGANGDVPSQYDRLSRMAWTLGAVYGKNTYPTDSVQELVYNHTSGRNEFKYIEAGNENNGGWLGDAYYNPHQATAYMSAYYNGNDGIMGSRMGIKNADSTIKVLFWGDVANIGDLHLNYLRAMNFWSTYTLKDSTLPFDVYNIHEYSYDTKAISPEDYKGGYRQYYKGIVDTTHIMCPTCEVWLTEWGYDRNRKSPLGVPIIAGKDSAQIQAEWIARGWFELSFSGLDRAQLFQIQNDPLTKDYDSTGYFKFNTSGLTVGHQRANYDLNYYAYPAYYFQHTIWKTLMNYKPDSVVYENKDSVWVYRYKNINHPDSIAYAIWSGTQTNKEIDTFAIKTGHNSAGVRIIKLKDKYMNGDTSNITTNNLGEVPLTITEAPQILFTTNGTGGGQLINYIAPTPPDTTVIHKAILYLTSDGKILILNKKKQ